MAKTHRDLAAWQLSMELLEQVYKVTGTFPDTEKFGLVNQMRRCAISVPSNIAEGAARQTSKEFIQFLYVARGSLSELQTQLEIAIRLKYCSGQHQNNELIERIFSVIYGLIRKLKN